MPIPSLLFNTVCLALASVGMAWSKSGAKAADNQKTKVGLAMAGVFVIVFVSGQTWAWQELNASGYFLSSNPANTFFYLITALHAFHVLGGLVAWFMTLRVFKGDAMMLQPESVNCCTTGTTCFWSGGIVCYVNNNLKSKLCLTTKRIF